MMMMTTITMVVVVVVVVSMMLRNSLAAIFFCFGAYVLKLRLTSNRLYYARENQTAYSSNVGEA